MSEWLDLMLEEIERKKGEQRDAEQEAERRESETEDAPAADQEK